LEELVANRFLLTPFSSNFVNEHNIVRLGNGNLLIIWSEANGAHNVALVVLFGGTRRELVHLLTVLVVQVNDSVRCGDSVSLRVGRPGQCSNLLHAVDWLLQVFQILNLHIVKDFVNRFLKFSNYFETIY